jgi:hypothetical protein
MKRNIFIASVATVISACLPLLARAEGTTQGGWTPTNAEAPGWPKPSWCCESAVVWLDIPRGVYYHKGDSQYGRTQRGAYSCEKHAVATGNRPG